MLYSRGACDCQCCVNKDQVCKTSFKISEALALTECSFESLTNNEKSIKLPDCRKCDDLEKQLHQVQNKLSSAQLIIALFNKEHKHDSLGTKISQQVRMMWKYVTNGYR
jgi:hypothetical protein